MIDDDDKLTDPDFDDREYSCKIKIVLYSCCYILLP